MAFTKTFSHTIDIASGNYSTGTDDIVMNILDKEVYTLQLTIVDGGTAVDLTSLTAEFLDGTVALPNVSVTDAATGRVDITFADVSGYSQNDVKSIILKITDGTLERHYKGFKMSFYTLP